MNVPLATQLLHKKVAAAINTYVALGALPPEAMATGNFCEKIGKLVKSFNGIKKKENPAHDDYHCALTDSSPHLKLWTQMFNEMDHWKFLGSRNIQFHHSWRMNMRAMAHLWIDLKEEGYDCLPCGHITQDCLENLFSTFQTNAGHRHNNTVSEFPSVFATAMVNMLTTSVKGKNCRDDNALNLIQLGQLYDAAEAVAAREAAEAREADSATEEADTPPSSGPDELPLPEMDFDDLDDPDPIQEDPEENEVVLEEEEETDDEPLRFNNNQFREQLQRQMGSINGASTAAPIIKRHPKLLQCEDCAKLLLSEVQFPLHLPHTMTESQIDAKLPSALISNLVKDVYLAASIRIPPVAHELQVLERFLKHVNGLESVKSFSLCTTHANKTPVLVKNIAREGLKSIVLAFNQDLKNKAKLKALKRRGTKIQRVLHM